MKIRKGEIKDFEKLLWAWNSLKNKILVKYIKRIEKGQHDFFVVENKEDIIGEIHLFLVEKDRQKSNGKNRVYLSTFRIREDFQSKGIGTKLINYVLDYIRKKGYTEVTIGAYNDEKRTQRYYKRLGFKKKIKIDKDTSIKPPKEFILFLKKL